MERVCDWCDELSEFEQMRFHSLGIVDGISLNVTHPFRFKRRGYWFCGACTTRFSSSVMFRLAVVNKFQTTLGV